MAGGNPNFNAVLGGGRSGDGQYARLEAHGLYWTASETDPASAWFYNSLLGVGKLSNARAVAKSRERSQFGVSGITTQNSVRRLPK
jgi:hypothetical protein